MPEDYVECAFMIPLVRNSDRTPHNPLAMRDLEDALFARLYRVPEPVAGKYTDRTKNRVEDESHRFIVALPTSRLDELRGILKRSCNTFDQESIYLAVAGKVELVFGKPEDGSLGDGT